MKVLDQVLRDSPTLLPRIVRVMPRLASRRLRQPVFIVGCGRSGKTVLAGVLGRHPAIALYPGEANRLWHPQLYPWRESPLRSEVPPIWVDPAGFARGSLTHRRPLDSEILSASFGAYQAVRRRPILLNESALLVVLIPFILQHFDHPTLIHFVRDGRAAASAWARRQYRTIRSDPEPYAVASLDFDFDGVLDCCARSWAWQVSEVKRLRDEGHLPDNAFRELRYEDFCHDPVETLAPVCEVLEIDPAPLERLDLEYVENRNPDDLAGLTPRQRRRIEGLMADALEGFGYHLA